jgi:hypothetical protein
MAADETDEEIKIDANGNKYVIDEDGHEQLILDFEDGAK